MNAEKAKCFGSFPPLMAGHKNNGRTDKSHAKSPYIHITELSGNPHVFAQASRIHKHTFVKAHIKVEYVFYND